MKKTAALWLTVFLFSAFFCGCQGDPPPGNAGSGESVSDSSSVPVPSGPSQEQESGQRDPKPVVLTPTAPGTEVIGNEAVSIDVSNKADGYMTVTYHGDNPKVKLQIKYVPD